MDSFALDFISLDDDNEYSDVDNLFGKLEIIEPPVEMVEQIMSAVSQLPLTRVPADDNELEPDGLDVNEAIA